MRAANRKPVLFTRDPFPGSPRPGPSGRGSLAVSGEREERAPDGELPPPPARQRLTQIELPVPEIMTVHEVAEYLRVTPRTVTTLAKRGSIPGKQIGGKLWRFSRKAITALM